MLDSLNSLSKISKILIFGYMKYLVYEQSISILHMTKLDTTLNLYLMSTFSV